jgi:tetratricopeptide (TPR) repeat protein
MNLSRRGRLVLQWCLVVVIGFISIGFYWGMNRPSRDLLLKEANTHLLRGELHLAREIVDALIRQDDTDAKAMLLAAEILIRQQRYKEAVAFLDKTVGEQEVSREACFVMGKLQMDQLKNLTEAEKYLSTAFQKGSEDFDVCERLIKIYAVVGLEAELEQMLIHQIERNRFNSFHLFLMAEGKFRVLSPQLMADAGTVDSGDKLSRFGHARIDFLNGRFDVAEDSVQKLISDFPSFLPAWLLLGEILLATDPERLSIWYSECPKAGQEHALYWKISGRWQAATNNHQTAWRCFGESIQRDGSDPVALYQLAQSLESTNPDVSQNFRLVAKQLDHYRMLVTTTSNRGDESQLLQTATHAENLGLIWEAYGWFRVCLMQYPESRSAADAVNRLGVLLPSLDDKRFGLDRNVVARFDYSGFPLPVSSERSEIVPNNKPESYRPTHISFQDDTHVAVPAFRYYNGMPATQQGFHRMYEFTGGGTAIIDIDSDGWPDIWFTQGKSRDSDETQYYDQIFRNRRGEAFENVTAVTNVKESGFSQGVAVGDINHDGFSDVYVANLGTNTLHVSNGDGTFTESDGVRNVARDSWSTSCALADISGDGNVDVYVVNYLSGDDVSHRVCVDASGRSQTCRPDEFEASQDQFLSGTGYGDFLDTTQRSGFVVPEGRGLGLIVADFEERSQLDIFVANDGCPNFYFTSENPASEVFTERAIVNGLALNGEGRSTACMGVAFGDINGDLLADLFVTNFENETNTLYRHTEYHTYFDATQAFSLTDPGRSTLGFGTVFADIDNDGWQDLFIVNGHVNDQRHAGSLFQMPPLLFRNINGKSFRHVDNSVLGPWFGKMHLGRSVAMTDWNRDGRVDFVVNCLLEDAAILTNACSETPRKTTLNLIGSDSPRVPIGSRIVHKTQGVLATHHLTAGDGYMASHQKSLFIGSGDVEQQEGQVEISWPSGKSQKLSVPPGSEIAVIEGRDLAYVLP